jgi:C1A family cysteine protease
MIFTSDPYRKPPERLPHYARIHIDLTAEMSGRRLIVATVLAGVYGKLYSEDHVHQKIMWEAFKSEHLKAYATMQEETQRLAFFLDNLKLADLRNEAELRNDGRATHGVTKFSDWSQAEFESRMLTADPSERSDDALERWDKSINTPNTNAGLVDWTGRYTTPVRDQGYCGSCWAFSATEQIESDAMRQLGVSYVLSPEQITQCDTTSGGCNGGYIARAYTYVYNAGGIETEADYPYTSYQGVTGTCHAASNRFRVGVYHYTAVSGEGNMAAYVQSTGPLSVCLDASSWSSYTGGVLSSCGTSVNHCVQAVGVDASSGGYWKVRNSWGTSWGEAGFIRLAYGRNTCAITNYPTWVSTYRVQ